MSTATLAPLVDGVTLDDKWSKSSGRIMISGTQAIARILLAQRELDSCAGFHTAGYISGYRGSPLGGVDFALWSVAAQLGKADVTFAPGVNEDLAATAVRGTQQLDFVPGARLDGVFAAWYGKGPGVDRSIDALKHGNYGGAHPKGGVIIFYGDDHGGKSSTVAHQSEQAIASAMIPSLYPADVGEVIRYGLLAYAMSRYSGSWIGMKLVNETAEQTATIDIDIPGFAPTLPPLPPLPAEGLHAARGYVPPTRQEQIVDEHRLPLVHAFVRANGIDRIEIASPVRKLAIVTAGKSFGDTRRALRLLDLCDERAAALGISLYKVGCIWPLEPEGLRAFAAGHDALFFVEEKKAFVEEQAARVFINEERRPRFIGKQDEDGRPLLSSTLQLDPFGIALAIIDRLRNLGIQDAGVTAAAEQLRGCIAAPVAAIAHSELRRAPFFCSGCPHNRSTKVPTGSLSMTGIGCHTMVALARPAEALMPTHMGGEGANWIGLAPFTNTKHIFQNMGDGTYYHSGMMAIRAAVASGANITYKILYNDAVAMTGGQPVDGPISVAEIAQQVRHEGVRKIVILSENPNAHRDNRTFPTDVRIGYRDELDVVQRELRDEPGCTVLIYEQTCAAEKRRRRKRGLYPDPPVRLHIAPGVCEGCGDCSVQSTCVSLQPRLTDLGVKRRIDQSSCNKDLSCIKGFCPSFITVRNPQVSKRPVDTNSRTALPDFPAPAAVSLGAGSFNMLIAGIGGTGVVTVGAILGMAAHLDGNAASLFDLTGLAQKNGAVFSHVRIGRTPEDLRAQRLSRGEADLVLAFDLVAGTDPDAILAFAPDRTRAIVNSNVTPTVAFQFNAAALPSGGPLLAKLERVTINASVVDATRFAAAIMGDNVGANLFMVGVAAQKGMLPISIAAVERAIQLNGTAVPFNLRAFQLGRLFVADPLKVEAMLPETAVPLDDDLESLIERRATHLAAYQGPALADRYCSLVERVWAVEQLLSTGEALTRTVATNYARVLAYKDEYEVARLLTDPALMRELRDTFGDGASFSYNLAPPILNGALDDGRPKKRSFAMKRFRPFLRILAKAKGLRGTAFDPFGYFTERRHERALIFDYEQLVRTVLGELTVPRIGEATAVLDHVAMVRGFGPVKAELLERYRKTLPAKLEAFLHPEPAIVA
jgi:indolepyruvate ferredoxin oxidoreductase